jgi:hypothetical protein
MSELGGGLISLALVLFVAASWIVFAGFCVWLVVRLVKKVFFFACSLVPGGRWERELNDQEKLRVWNKAIEQDRRH